MIKSIVRSRLPEKGIAKSFSVSIPTLVDNSAVDAKTLETNDGLGSDAAAAASETEMLSTREQENRGEPSQAQSQLFQPQPKQNKEPSAYPITHVADDLLEQ